MEGVDTCRGKKNPEIYLCIIGPRYVLVKSILSSHVKSNHFNILVLQVSHEVASKL